MPISWQGTLQQYAGRLHKQFESKREVQVYDYVDAQIPMFMRMYSKRLKGYKDMGYSETRK
jgi:superfamily II DNA or RNA helicase